MILFVTVGISIIRTEIHLKNIGRSTMDNTKEIEIEDDDFLAAVGYWNDLDYVNAKKNLLSPYMTQMLKMESFRT